MLEKVKTFLKTAKGKAVSAVASAGAVLGSAMPVMAAETGSSTTFVDGIKTLWSQITEQVNIGNVVAIIGICLGVCVGLALFWFGLRYVIRKVMAAVKKGKVSA